MPNSMRKLLRASLPVLFVALFTAAVLAQSAGGESTAEANKAVVKRAFAAFNEGDLKTLNELFDADGPWHLPNGKTIPQGGPFAELAKSCPMCAALEQRKIVIDVMVAESDLVSVRSTWSGLYTGTVRGVSFHQKPVTLVYFNIYRVSGGRIRENWAEYDRMSMVEQLGFQVTPPSNPQ
ncbi:MAG: ester cyclase [Terracidiphilus sp.]